MPKAFGVVAAVVLVGLAAVGGYFLWQQSEDYTVKVALTSAVGVVEGTPVQVDGADVGSVVDVQVRGDRAVATLAVSGRSVPLHAGTSSKVEWRSLLGERYLRLDPGPVRNPALPSGSLLEDGAAQVTVEDLLETLDPPTRKRVSSLAKQLDLTFTDRQKQANDTIRTAGPAVDSLGKVLAAVGQDGPAIRQLLTRLHGVTGQLSSRRGELSGVVRDLSSVTGAAAGQERALRDAVGQLPPTLDTVKSTLDKVPGAVDTAGPLLDDLRPASRQLVSVSRNLKPVLRDLRPTVADLRPTLDSASELLRFTPGLLDNTHATLPAVSKAVNRLAPAVEFLRPFTPEAIGFASNWGKGFSYYDSVGMIGRANVHFSTGMLDSNPGLPALLENDTHWVPGSSVGQPWTDANGSSPR